MYLPGHVLQDDAVISSTNWHLTHWSDPWDQENSGLVAQGCCLLLAVLLTWQRHFSIAWMLLLCKNNYIEFLLCRNARDRFPPQTDSSKEKVEERKLMVNGCWHEGWVNRQLNLWVAWPWRLSTKQPSSASFTVDNMTCTHILASHLGLFALTLLLELRIENSTVLWTHSSFGLSDDRLSQASPTESISLAVPG